MLADLHTDAITCLLEGREEEGIHRFHECLALAKTWCDHGIPQQQGLPSAEDDDDDTVEPNIFEISIDGAIDPDSQFGCSHRADVSVSMNLYRNIFGTDGLYSITSKATLLQMVSVISFNLGITFHERGLVCGDTTMVSRARSLYSFSLRLVDNDKTQAGELDLSALELALLNNLWHVSAFFLDFESLAKHRERMLAKLASVPPQAVCAFEFFQQNCLSSHDIPTTGAFAPAA
mmetsp:Transcript_14761/g.28069  ORF Transcript_14761/g.28069 Transcript_14761/m.28069 type:complete len:233 (+) Transcript_14761:221-919(+)|eukprot:scaffold5364_cov164-Amphora_coffeaeformis.AAC.2